MESTTGNRRLVVGQRYQEHRPQGLTHKCLIGQFRLGPHQAHLWQIIQELF